MASGAREAAIGRIVTDLYNAHNAARDAATVEKWAVPSAWKTQEVRLLKEARKLTEKALGRLEIIT